VTDSPITRRDFLGSTLLGAGASLLAGISPAQILAASGEAGQTGDGSGHGGEDDWTGYGGTGDYRYANGNTF